MTLKEKSTRIKDKQAKPKKSTRQYIREFLQFIKAYWPIIIALIIGIVTISSVTEDTAKLAFTSSIIFLFGLQYILNKNNLVKLLGILTIIFGFSLFLFTFDSFLGHIVLIFLLILVSMISFFMSIAGNSAVKTITFVAQLLLFLLAIEYITPTINEILNLTFSKNQIAFLPAILITLIISFIALTFYTLFKQLLSLIAISSKNDKMDNIYLAISLALITIIFFSGFWAAKTLYVNDYPLEFGISGEVITSGNLTCVSTSDRVYFLEGDTIKCSGPVETESSFSLRVKNVSGISYHHTSERENNEPLVFMIRELTPKRTTYEIYFSAIDEKFEPLNLQVETLEIKPPISREVYNQQIRERIGFVAGIFLVALFSVFSAVANLKKLLESERPNPNNNNQ